MSVVVTINAGSSSLKFAIFEGADLAPLCRGQVENIGGSARILIRDAQGKTSQDIRADDHGAALRAVLTAIEGPLGGRDISAVGHRIVHGGPDRDGPVVLNDAVIDELAGYAPFAPLHQPHNLACLRAAREVFDRAPQIGCFDTAFHRHHPWVNDTFALPRALYDEGVRRYGFHGLSYDYIASALRDGHPDMAAGRVIVAHLGNGASMCAMRDGASVGSTMGFSALDGLPMGTRCGQIDPGVLLYLMDQKGMQADEISDLLYKHSGLKGLSGVSHDMRTLQASDAPEAAQAIDYFVFRIAREIGAMAAVLGGVDGVVFTGGIGENSALVRARVIEGLGFLGLSVDQDANDQNAVQIGNGPVPICVIPTNEELVIARACAALT